MKLIFEKNNGDKVSVDFNNRINETEIELDTHLALEYMWESLKEKIAKEYQTK